MSERHRDGSAGDVDYAAHGLGYARFRQAEPRIEAFIREALGDARTVLNVGAGAGSYEPTDREVIAVEPSASMRAQRPAHLPRAIDATAERLPFEAGRFDASMATFTIHQWKDMGAGLREMRRVTKGPIVLLTGDPDRLRSFWLYDYAPEVVDTEARRCPAIDSIVAASGSACDVVPVPIPLECRDGFSEAYCGRPEMLLLKEARLACSAWSFVDAAVVARFEQSLRHDLETGAWDARFGRLRTQPTFEGSLVLVISRP